MIIKYEYTREISKLLKPNEFLASTWLSNTIHNYMLQLYLLNIILPIVDEYPSSGTFNYLRDLLKLKSIL